MGQIQTSQMELEALCAQLAPVFLEYLRAHGTAVNRIEEATSLDGITSLPARYSLGGVEKNVLAPLKLLTKDVDAQIEVCTEATTKANAAADNANAAATRAENVVDDVTQAKQDALDAAAKATLAAATAEALNETSESVTADMQTLKTAIEEANEDWTSAEEARAAAETARASAEETRAAAETERTTAEAARQEAETSRANAETDRASAEETRTANETERTTAETARAAAETTRQEQEEARETASATAVKNAEDAADRSNNLSDHRDEIRDGYWWRWNEETGEWYNTGEIAKGNVMYATFEIETETGNLYMYTDEEYTGPEFEYSDSTGKLVAIV